MCGDKAIRIIIIMELNLRFSDHGYNKGHPHNYLFQFNSTFEYTINFPMWVELVTAFLSKATAV